MILVVIMIISIITIEVVVVVITAATVETCTVAIFQRHKDRPINFLLFAVADDQFIRQLPISGHVLNCGVVVEYFVISEF